MNNCDFECYKVCMDQFGNTMMKGYLRAIMSVL